MSADDQTLLLERADAVQAAVDAGEWLRAGELEASFREVLERVVATHRDSSGADAQALRAVLEQAAERVIRLIGELRHHERRVMREATTIRTGHLAKAAYGAAANEQS